VCELIPYKLPTTILNLKNSISLYLVLLCVFLSLSLLVLSRPVPKIRWREDATRVDDAYTQGEYPTYTR